MGGVDPDRERKVWIAWEEGGRLPDVIVELLSPSTAKKDRTEKRDLYARVFRTAEYFLCDPETGTLEGLRLAGRFYQSIQPDENGRLWSEQLGVFLGTWHGVVDGRKGDWVRLFRPDGSLVPTPEERGRRADASGPRRRRPSSLGCGPCSQSAAEWGAPSPHDPGFSLALLPLLPVREGGRGREKRAGVKRAYTAAGTPTRSRMASSRASASSSPRSISRRR